jgi:hypothetical protein
VATFEAQAILDAVDAGTMPDEWRVYRARKSYLLGQGLFLFIVGLLILFCSCALMAMGLVIFVISQRDAGTLISSAASLLFGLGGSALSIAILWAGASLWWQMRTAATQVLVLTPDGFVARTAVQPKIPLTDSAFTPPAIGWTGTSTMRIYTVAYSKARTVALVVRHTRADTQISLDLTLKTPNPRAKVRWLVDPRFGASESIAQNIIEAHTRYMTTHEKAQ